jgi:hypothetical protein
VYHLKVEINEAKQSGGSRIVQESPVWKVCWKLNVPNVVKLFLWRACNDLLPTKVNLSCKGINIYKLCPICQQEEEMIVHTLWNCPMTCDV